MRTFISSILLGLDLLSICLFVFLLSHDIVLKQQLVGEAKQLTQARKELLLLTEVADSYNVCRLITDRCPLIAQVDGMNSVQLYE